MQVLSGLLGGQTPSRVAGTVESKEARGFLVKPDNGAQVTVIAAEGTRVQRVQPGERDLSKAETIALADIVVGDRVLVRGHSAGAALEAESVIVMSARAIAQKQEAERRMWQERGLFGVAESVDAVAGTVKLAVRGRAEAPPIVVAVSPKTVLRRYASDSVRFADAVEAKLSVMRKGDQVRVLGEKDASGARITAEQIVFGTFRTIAGTVVKPAADGVITIRNVENGRALLVRMKPDSQIKRFPQAAPMGMRPGLGGAGRDLGAMLDRMPAAKLEELKPGETVIVSSTVGARPDELTAIVVLAGAEPVLAQITARAAARRGQDPLAAAGGLERSLDGMMGMPVQ